MDELKRSYNLKLHQLETNMVYSCEMKKILLCDLFGLTIQYKFKRYRTLKKLNRMYHRSEGMHTSCI